MSQTLGGVRPPPAGAEKPTLPRTCYVMGSTLPAKMLADMQSGRRPQAEFSVFLARHPETSLLDGDAAASFSGVLGAGLSRLRQGNWATALAALAIRPRPELYLTTGEDIGIPLALLAGFRGDRRPVHIITHGSFFASAKFRRLMLLVRRLPRVHFLCLSATIRDRLVSEFGVARSRAHDTSYATDVAFFDPAKADLDPRLASDPAGRPLVAAVGAASRDYRTLVRAVSDFGGALRLCIAADSAWFRMSVDVTPESLPEHVKLASFAYPELRSLYRTALFVVIPLYEGRHACGYSAIVEAMAMGKAVIATRTENYSDFIVEGETGLLVSPGDVLALKSAIDSLLRDPERAIAMGDAARKRTVALFSEERYVERIEDVLSRGWTGAIV